jgi:hypothetical protein
MHIRKQYPSTETKGFMNAQQREWTLMNDIINSECCLANSHVDITQCQHGTFLSLYFFVLYYKNNKIFFHIDIVISTLVEIGKTRNCAKTLQQSCFHTISHFPKFH